MSTLGRLYFDVFLIFNIFPIHSLSFLFSGHFYQYHSSLFSDSTYLFFLNSFFGVTCPYCSGSQPVCRDTQVSPGICSSVLLNLKLSHKVYKAVPFLLFLTPRCAAKLILCNKCALNSKRLRNTALLVVFIMIFCLSAIKWSILSN